MGESSSVLAIFGLRPGRPGGPSTSRCTSVATLPFGDKPTALYALCNRCALALRVRPEFAVSVSIFCFFQLFGKFEAIEKVLMTDDSPSTLLSSEDPFDLTHGR